MTKINESEIGQRLQIEAAKYGCVLLRNNSGAFKDMTGRLVRYGLGNISQKHSEQMKSSDFIGITTITITPEMVGMRVGIFTASETKPSDWNPAKKLDKHEQAQKNFMDWVIARGGIAGFINAVDSFPNLLRCCGFFTRIG